MHYKLRIYFGRTRWYSWVKRLKWNLGLVYLEIVLVLMQDRCMLCMEHTICLEKIWTHLMKLLDDVCHMKSRFDLFGDSVCFGATYMHGLWQMHHRLRNHFRSTRWYS